MPTLIEWMESIGVTGKDIMLTADDEKDYNPFVINRGLANHIDTIMYAQELNKMPGISKRMHYDFLRLGVFKKKRYGKWAKLTKPEESLKGIQEYYGVNLEIATEYAEILTEEQTKTILKNISKEDTVSKGRK